MVLKNIKTIAGLLKEKEVTRLYPEVKTKVSERYRGGQELIAHRCIGCGSCVRICPNGCIELTKMESSPYQSPKNKKQMYPQIDVGTCLFCGLCEDACPTNALLLTKNYELASWNRDDLIYSPERLIPDDIEERFGDEIKKMREDAKQAEEKKRKQEENEKEKGEKKKKDESTGGME